MAQKKWGVIKAGYEAWYREHVRQSFIIKEGEEVIIVAESQSAVEGKEYSIKTADGSAGVTIPARFVELF